MPRAECQHIVPRPIPGPLAVGQDFLNIGVIEKRPDKIAALFAVRVFGKESGDFHPIVFKGITGAEQFVFLAVLVIVGDFRAGVKVMLADLKSRGAYRSQVNRCLFFCGEGSGQAYTISLIATSSADAWMLFIRPTHFI